MPVTPLGLKQYIRAFRQILADPLRKPVAQIIFESARTAFRAREFPRRYFLSFVYRRDAGPPEEYLSHREHKRHVFSSLREDAVFKSILTDKLRFHERFSQAGFPVPRLLAHNDGRRFWVAGQEREIADSRGFAALVTELARQTGQDAVFVKPIDGMKGRNAGKLHVDAENLAPIHAQITTGRCLFQELVVQHDLLRAIHPASVNTVRVLSCAPGGGEPTILAAVLRMGRRGSEVDNISRGGLYIAVELETGRLLPPARTDFTYGGEVFPSHPDTGFAFAGARLPHFTQVIEIVRRGAAMLPHQLVGWDVALTLRGPVLIEANAGADIALVEIATCRGALAHPSFRAMQWPALFSKE
jgi:hypothetical protein